MDISSLFERMLVLFATIGIGFLITKLGMMDAEFNCKLTRIILNVLTPLLTLSSVLNTQRTASGHEVLTLTLIAALCYVFLIAASALVPKLFRTGRENAGVYRYIFIFSNIGFMGYPVVQALLGTGAIFYVSIFALFFNIVVFTMGIWLIGGEKGRFRVTPKMLCEPAILASVAAYVIYLTGLRVPTVVADIVSYTGDLTSPLSMIVLGCSLAQIPVGSIFRNGKVYGLLLLKMVAVPLLAYACLHPLVKNQMVLCMVVVMLSMPVATNATMMALEYGGDQNTASSSVFVSTLLSLITIPVIMWLLFCR